MLRHRQRAAQVHPDGDCAARRLASGRPARALVVAVAIALEQTFAESSKLLFGRPRPSRELVAVMGNPTGLSFPSTFMTLYSVTVGALGGAGVADAGRRRSAPAVLVVAGVVAGRGRGGAHRPRRPLAQRRLRHDGHPHDWLAVAFAAAGAERR